MRSITVFAIALLSVFFHKKTGEEQRLAQGRQPEMSTDDKGVVRVVFGRGDSILYNFIRPRERSASETKLIARVAQMHLGMTRGPQIASSNHFSVVTAMDKAGDIHWFLLDHKTGNWRAEGIINDIKGSAPEGLMGLACDAKDHFYAVWLDIRRNRRNNICFASLTAADGKWSPNKIIYESPEGHTCECCKPNVAVRGSHVAVMFRNWLKGSRDLFVMESDNGGKRFGRAEKLGLGTWKLDGCPMDGGGIAITPDGQVATVWQRQGTIFFCLPHHPETALGQGRACSIGCQGTRLVCAYQQGPELVTKDMATGRTEKIGNGSFLHCAPVADGSLLCLWEQDNQIVYQLK